MNSNGFKKAAKAFFVGVMIFSVGFVLAEDFAAKSKVPECKGTDTSKWDKCYGKATNLFSGITYQGMWSQGKKHGAGLLFFANGDKYDGDFKDGEWKNGNLTYSSGEEYQGDFKNGKRHGKGTFINAYGEKYVGSFKNDERDGSGTFEYQNGDKYEGGWVNGFRHGFGKMTFSNGDVYTGTFRDGKFHGSGTTIYADGRKYIGQFSNNKQHGLGNFTRPDGGKYAGEYKNDEPHGKGKLIVSDGSVYEGEFKDGLANGHGKLIYSDGSKHEGNFKNGERHGEGKYEYSNGHKYVGYFKNNVKSGLGTFIGSNGDKFLGQFYGDTFHGWGIYTFANGTTKEGIWHKGVLVKSEKINPRIFKKCEGSQVVKWSNCWGYEEISGWFYSGQFLNGEYFGRGSIEFNNGIGFIGSFEKALPNGFGIYTLLKNEIYVGGLKSDRFEGEGAYLLSDGSQILAVWRDGENIGPVNNNSLAAVEIASVIANIKQTKENKTNVLNLDLAYTEPAADGSFTITIKTSADTASLKVNDEEHGGNKNGIYSIRKVARAGQETVFTIVATDVNGNTGTKTITVNRPVVDSKPLMAALNPAQVRKQPQRDAVAIIIGIADYKNLPRADFANDDASVFYDYAIRALGINAENIKLLVDANADDVAIYQAFKTWLPSRVRATTDVYVYYSGHGLPAEDGKGLYLMPQRAHRDLIEKTAISQQEINGFIQAARPSSVTIFLDSCYSGLARSGETLLASARPVVLKSDKNLFPNNFTVITASQADQISSSSPDLKHGIFSYYLMKGMEGEADADRDGRITLGEMQRYLVDNVGRHAGVMNRKQEPQLIGDPNRVLVGR
jgi:hypothetical protein